MVAARRNDRAVLADIPVAVLSVSALLAIGRREVMERFGSSNNKTDLPFQE